MKQLFGILIFAITFYSTVDFTFSITASEVIKLKKAGVDDSAIQAMIGRESLKAANKEKGVDEGLTVNEIIKLKTNGVSDVTIQKMLEREEREKVRWKGVTHVHKREDGKRVIVYGLSDKPPWPETKHYFFDTRGNVTLILDQPVDSKEAKAWDMLKNLRIYNKISN